ncbi:hypothetical protein CRG98_033833 [Punica granatum]|uniref:Uncharacterized protein n=1 Tax=Punica granatum TaxID=22663 RepID=A0A2I0IQX2_PUNGR|nr:hypothetical protein CRG98_033833 [Punica granatum]
MAAAFQRHHAKLRTALCACNYLITITVRGIRSKILEPDPTLLNPGTGTYPHRAKKYHYSYYLWAVANRKSPIPNWNSVEGLSGEPTGSRQSSRGSSRPKSHSKVEAAMLKELMYESRLRLGSKKSLPPRGRHDPQDRVRATGRPSSASLRRARWRRRLHGQRRITGRMAAKRLLVDSLEVRERR